MTWSSKHRKRFYLEEIRYTIEVVVYADNQECNDWLEVDTRYRHVIPEEVLQPLRALNGQSDLFSFNSHSTVSALINTIKEKMNEWDLNDDFWKLLNWAFVNGDRYYIEDNSKNLLTVISKYNNYPDNKTLRLQCLISSDAGEVDNAEGLEYYMYSHERGSHHYPHVHVNTTDHNHSAVIRIDNGEIISGKLPAKYRRKAKKRILNNKEHFYKCWNTKTDGIRVDINKHFGLIGY